MSPTNPTSPFRRRYRILAAAAAFPALLGLFLYLNGRKSDVPAVRTICARTAPLQETVPANGRIRPVTEVSISPDVSGEIVELPVREGDRVRRGDRLAGIRQDAYRSAVDQAEASLNVIRTQARQQQARLERAEAEFRRNETLFRDSVISASEYEISRTEYRLAREESLASGFHIANAEAILAEARENLRKTTIRSPMDGIVSRLDVELGERVVGTSQTAGTELMRIADFSRMEVLAEINENDILKVSPGDSARISIDAYPGRTFTGTVTRIANSARYTGRAGDLSASFEVRVLILPGSYRDLQQKTPVPLLPGMSASLDLETDFRDSVLTVPLSCITARISDADVFVLLDDGTVRCRPVQTGIQDISRIEITAGLSAGERVVSGPYHLIQEGLEDGMTVRESRSEAFSGEKTKRQEPQ